MGGDKRDTGQTSRRQDTGIASLRAHNGKVVSSSKGEKEVLVVYYRKLEPPTASGTFNAEFEKEINVCAKTTVDASERKDSGSEGLQIVHKGISD